MPVETLALNDAYIRDAVEMLGRQETAEQIAEYYHALRQKEVAQAQAEGVEKYNLGWREGWRKSDSWANLTANCLIVLGVVGAIAFLVFLGTIDGRAHARQLAACEAGQTIPCMDAVSDQQRNYSSATDEKTDSKSTADRHRDRIQLLRAAYKLKTGEELPAIGEEASNAAH